MQSLNLNHIAKVNYFIDPWTFSHSWSFLIQYKVRYYHLIYFRVYNLWSPLELSLFLLLSDNFCNSQTAKCLALLINLSFLPALFVITIHQIHKFLPTPRPSSNSFEKCIARHFHITLLILYVIRKPSRCTCASSAWRAYKNIAQYQSARRDS